MVNAPEDYICFEADYDLDGLPDDFEGNITIFNGNTVYSDPIVRDTDGDGLTDGEEIELVRIYRNNGTEVSVYAFLNSDPSSEDGDMDGLSDTEDPYPNKFNFYCIYDRTAAITYAHQYAYEPNYDVYPYYDADCANFVSQCLFAGGIQMNKEWYFYSAGYKVLNLFWINENYSTTWTVAFDQYDYFLNDENVSYGDVIVFDSVEDMQQKLESGSCQIEPGDLLYMQWEYDYPHHAAIIDGVTSSSITYSAHTESRSEDDIIDRFWNNNPEGKLYVIHLKEVIITI